MNMPFVVPDWVPWWVPLVLLVPTLLYALAFLFMPFSVLGVKTRLDAIEMRLDEIQQEIRQLALRLPAGREELDFEDVYAPTQARRTGFSADRPPIPPAAQDLYDDDAPVERVPPPPNMRPVRRQEPQVVRPEPQIVRGERAEPRLDRRR
jgi:hypothetical protein